MGLNNTARSGGFHSLRPDSVNSYPLTGATAKRAFDTGVAAVLLLVAIPFLALIALAIWLADGRPVTYRHRRVGLKGAEFGCLKFRTMVRASDRVLAAHLAASPRARAEWEATRKLRDDPRILGRLGRFLRRHSLDELRQVLNVLCGEMSLVGPRPIVREELAHYGAESRWYLAVRPGLTGPWQIGGRNDASYATRVRLDVQYVKAPPNLRLDLRILLATARVVLTSKGAY